MTVLTEGAHAGGFIVREANGTRSREQITVLDGETLVAGQVLGLITASGKYVAHDPDGTDGSETAAGILFDDVTADGADVEAVAIVRDAEVNQAELEFDGISTTNENDAIAALAAVGIIMR